MKQLVMPVLVETKAYAKIGDLVNVFGILVIANEDMSHHYKQNLILVSLKDEKVEIGDKYYDSHNNLVLVATTQSDHNVYHYKKVMAVQSQIPVKYIQRFIEEYNGRNIKEIEIEMESWTNKETCCSTEMLVRPPETITCPICNKSWMNLGCGVRHLITHYKPKLTNGCVTIVDKEESVLYSKEEVIDCMVEFASYVLASYAKDVNPISATEWLKQNKKK